ncbi:hypothetical protein SJ05684_b49820 (plasmid) [Sinorhizobium sojae CCBAU 05684]|uniref:Uncharacterized protein n=1 Tax=Sinorhizobium sojae CCBAU 05684 TaxID=716928 RepID=A0A249PJV4_9HYPH|nr:hypothetical protein SJ05684_b49820 [Sinorhizobium sojae CCBAU 05684]
MLEDIYGDARNTTIERNNILSVSAAMQISAGLIRRKR